MTDQPFTIGFISSDWGRVDQHLSPGGSNYYRCWLPARALHRNLGWSTFLAPNLAVTPDGSIAAAHPDGTLTTDLDLVVIQRWHHPDAADVIRRAQAAGQRVVLDVDDWYYGLRTTNRAFKGQRSRMSATTAAIGAADLLTVSTQYLADRLPTSTDRVVVPNAIDADRFDVQGRQDAAPDRRTLVGWVGATGWRSGDLETLRGVLDPALAKAGAVFAHRGYREGDPHAADLAGVDLVSRWAPKADRPMAPITEYPSLFAGLDVGLVPLSDTPFNQAKSDVKGMEYAAAGVPFVAGATEAYRERWPDMIARRPRDWRKALDRLLADPDARAERVLDQCHLLAGRTIGECWPNWAKVYQSLV